MTYYWLNVQIHTRGDNPLAIVKKDAEMAYMEHTITDADPVNLIERAMLALENERDELLTKRKEEEAIELIADDKLIAKYTGNRSHMPCPDFYNQVIHGPHQHSGDDTEEQIKSCPGYEGPKRHKIMTRPIKDNPQA